MKVKFVEGIFCLFLLFFLLSERLWNQEIEDKNISDKKKKAYEFFEKGLLEKKLSKKEEYYLKAIEYFPFYAEAHNNLGDVYEKQGRYEEAIKEYSIAIAINPSFGYGYFGLGDVYFKMGKWEMAIINYEKGLKLLPDDKESLENIKIAKILNEKILFRFNTFKLTDEAINKLKNIAEILSSPKLTDFNFLIEGHTDNIGPEEYNLILSLKRAEEVKKYLMEKAKIDEKRLKVKGYGEDRPVGDNGTKEGRQINRRVEISIDLNVEGKNIKSDSTKDNSCNIDDMKKFKYII